jgi:hypothetical protein
VSIVYQDIGAAVTDVNFQLRVIGGLNAQCVVVNNEGAVANHTLRIALMGRVISSPVDYARKFTPLICSISPVSGLASYGVATDAQLLTGIAAVWDAFALQGL